VQASYCWVSVDFGYLLQQLAAVERPFVQLS